jgi:hypothetical protein
MGLKNGMRLQWKKTDYDYTGGCKDVYSTDMKDKEVY